MAFSSLEENNQRVEREEMFREENHAKLNLARYRSARSLLEYNRELMLKEDFRAQDQRMILLLSRQKTRPCVCSCPKLEKFAVDRTHRLVEIHRWNTLKL